MENFSPGYFLHKWSATNKLLYNEAGNNNQYARCQIDDAGGSLTWLVNHKIPRNHRIFFTARVRVMPVLGPFYIWTSATSTVGRGITKSKEMVRA